MMKVAIVGTSIDLTEEETTKMRIKIAGIIEKYNTNVIVLSGGAKGVDNLAVDVAKLLGFKTEVMLPKKQNWEWFKRRNLKIAKDCDYLYCLTIPVRETKCYHHANHQNHEKTAGCWTMTKALQLGKICELIIV